MSVKKDYDRVMTRLLRRQRLILSVLRLTLLVVGFAMRAWEWVAKKVFDIHPTNVS